MLALGEASPKFRSLSVVGKRNEPPRAQRPPSPAFLMKASGSVPRPDPLIQERVGYGTRGRPGACQMVASGRSTTHVREGLAANGDYVDETVLPECTFTAICTCPTVSYGGSSLDEKSAVSPDAIIWVDRQRGLLGRCEFAPVPKDDAGGDADSFTTATPARTRTETDTAKRDAASTVTVLLRGLDQPREVAASPDGRRIFFIEEGATDPNASGGALRIYDVDSQETFALLRGLKSPRGLFVTANQDVLIIIDHVMDLKQSLCRKTNGCGDDDPSSNQGIGRRVVGCDRVQVQRIICIGCEHVWSLVSGAVHHLEHAGMSRVLLTLPEKPNNASFVSLPRGSGVDAMREMREMRATAGQADCHHTRIGSGHKGDNIARRDGGSPDRADANAHKVKTANDVDSEFGWGRAERLVMLRNGTLLVAVRAHRAARHSSVGLSSSQSALISSSANFTAGASSAGNGVLTSRTADEVGGEIWAFNGRPAAARADTTADVDVVGTSKNSDLSATRFYSASAATVAWRALPVLRALTLSPQGNLVFAGCGTACNGEATAVGLMQSRRAPPTRLVHGFATCVTVDRERNVYFVTARSTGALRALWAYGTPRWRRAVVKLARHTPLPISPRPVPAASAPERIAGLPNGVQQRQNRGQGQGQGPVILSPLPGGGNGTFDGGGNALLVRAVATGVGTTGGDAAQATETAAAAAAAAATAEATRTALMEAHTTLAHSKVQSTTLKGLMRGLSVEWCSAIHHRVR